MASEKLILRTLRPEDETAFQRAVQGFSASDPDIEFAFQYNDNMDFKAYVEMVNAWPYGEKLPAQFVPNTFYVGVVAGRIVGRLSFRHELNDFLERLGGHIGYCVIPSQQRRGYATEMLKQFLDFARVQGRDRVLITCDTDNIASMKVILHNGGVLENTTDEPELKVQKNRYWINLTV